MWKNGHQVGFQLYGYWYVFRCDHMPLADFSGHLNIHAHGRGHTVMRISYMYLDHFCFCPEMDVCFLETGSTYYLNLRGRE